ncbi:MAG: DNA repair protein RecO (recombination protein O) [Bacteroidia bacterium]
MRIALQPSYVLHSRPYRDSSAILEVFTAEHGRISLVARGARRQAKRGSRAGLLQPFTPLLMSFSGRSELRTLGTVEAAGQPWNLNGQRMFSGMYLNELLVRLLHRHDAHPQLFAAYGEAIKALAQPGTPDAVLRRFELTLVQEMGYDLALGVDADTGNVLEAGQFYRFEPGQGLVVAGQGDRLGSGRYPAEHLLLMARGEYGGEAGRTAKHLLREVLGEHLGDAPLRSRELFQARQNRSADTGVST